MEWFGLRPKAQANAAQTTLAGIRTVGTRANVYQGISQVLDAFEETAFDGYEKTLVVFVDGQDDLRLEAFNSAASATRAKALGVRIFIAHLDQTYAIDNDDDVTRLFPDDPDYWKGRQDSCADDSECKNFETCRIPQANGGDDPEANAEPYCMPTRSSDGQLGPIFEYAQIACETGGGYIYINDNQTISNSIDYLPQTMDGLWKAEVTIDTFENETVPMDEMYYFETTFEATVGGDNKNIELGRDGRATNRASAQDTRSIVYY